MKFWLKQAIFNKHVGSQSRSTFAIAIFCLPSIQHVSSAQTCKKMNLKIQRCGNHYNMRICTNPSWGLDNLNPGIPLTSWKGRVLHSYRPVPPAKIAMTSLQAQKCRHETWKMKLQQCIARCHSSLQGIFLNADISLYGICLCIFEYLANNYQFDQRWHYASHKEQKASSPKVTKILR